jgi:hypothetical protein
MKSNVYNKKQYKEITAEFAHLLPRKEFESDDEYIYRINRGCVPKEVKERLISKLPDGFKNEKYL